MSDQKWCIQKLTTFFDEVKYFEKILAKLEHVIFVLQKASSIFPHFTIWGHKQVLKSIWASVECC